MGYSDRMPCVSRLLLHPEYIENAGMKKEFKAPQGLCGKGQRGFPEEP